MAKSAHNDFYDAALNVIKNGATRMTLCNAEPTTYTQANATFALANVTMASGDFTGPAAGDVSGRKITTAAKSAVPVTTTGTGNHVALLDVAGSKLLYVTTTTPQGVSSGGTVDKGSWKIEIQAPAA
jgi:hypothetical protein